MLLPPLSLKQVFECTYIFIMYSGCKICLTNLTVLNNYLKTVEIFFYETKMYHKEQRNSFSTDSICVCGRFCFSIRGEVPSLPVESYEAKICLVVKSEGCCELHVCLSI